MPNRRAAGILGILAIGILSAVGFAQSEDVDIETLKKSAPRIYLDCGGCDLDYIKTEIPFVNYVRDRKEAQVHVLITMQSTGSGGHEYTMTFLGQNEFAGVDDSTRCFTNKTDTADDVRRKMTHALKQGLLAYVARTPIASRITIRYEEERTPAAADDKWNSWLFNIGGNVRLNGEESVSGENFGLNITANRVTLASKFRLGLSAGFDDDRFTYDDQVIRSSQSNFSASGLYVVSLGDHWSAGLSLDSESSSYENIRFDFAPAPAVEYNLFPYAEATRRQLRLLYRLRFRTVRYREETIFDKLKESLWNQSLSVTLDLKEKWGSVSTSLSGSHYLHDPKLNRLNLFSSIQLNLVKGLSAHVFGGGSRVRDQLSLVKGDASIEEVLLRRRQLQTSYNYFLMVGFNYTFGSIFTNVVNPRFGRTGGGLSIVIH